MGERETFADKVAKNGVFNGEPTTIQIPYFLAWAVRFIQGDKTFEEYVLDAIEKQIMFENSRRITDARILESYLESYRRNREEQKIDCGQDEILDKETK